MKAVSPLKNKRRSAILIGSILATITTGAAVWFFISAPTDGANPNNPKQVAMGKRIYSANCAACHGADLEGQPNWRSRKPDGRLPAPPHDETGHTWHHPDAHLFKITRNGLKPPLAPEGYESDMPAFVDVVSDDEIWAVLAFIKSTWPSPIRARQTSINERSR